jgi:hypothetical protein
MTTKSLVEHYAHVSNGGIEFEIKETKEEDFHSQIRFHTQVSNFGCYMENSFPIDAKTAKWLIKSLNDIMPLLEKSQNISDDDESQE